MSDHEEITESGVIDTSGIVPLNSPHQAPVIYADGAGSIAAFNGTIRFSLLQDSFDNDGNFVRKIVQTIVFPQGSFESVLGWLNQSFGEMKALQENRANASAEQ